MSRHSDENAEGTNAKPLMGRSFDSLTSDEKDKIRLLRADMQDLQNGLTNWNNPSRTDQEKFRKLIVLGREIQAICRDYQTVNEDIGVYYEALKDFEAAKVAYEQALEEGSFKTTLVKLSRLLYDKGHYKEALDRWNQMLEKEISRDYLLDFRAKIYRKLGEDDLAQKDERLYAEYQAREKAKWDDPNHYYHYK